MAAMSRKPYPTDMSDEEWSFAAPNLTLMQESAPQRQHSLREVFNALRWIVRAGAPWRLLPNNFPPWEAVYQQSRRWLQAGCYSCGSVRGVEASRARWCSTGAPCSRVVRAGRARATTATSARRARRCAWPSTRSGTCWPPTSRRPTSRSGPKSGRCARRCTPSRATASGSPGPTRATWASSPAQEAKAHGIELQVVKLPEAKKGFVLLPRRWVVERSFAWVARFRRLARDYERLPDVLRGLHFLGFAMLMLPKVGPLLAAAGSS